MFLKENKDNETKQVSTKGVERRKFVSLRYPPSRLMHSFLGIQNWLCPIHGPKRCKEKGGEKILGVKRGRNTLRNFFDALEIDMEGLLCIVCLFVQLFYQSHVFASLFNSCCFSVQSRNGGPTPTIRASMVAMVAMMEIVFPSPFHE